MAETGIERLNQLFLSVRAQERAALLPYLTAGLPDADTSVALFEAMAAAGADGFEIGIPYSDPLMDGPVIAEAGARSLAAGTTTQRCITHQKPVEHPRITTRSSHPPWTEHCTISP